jgi:hypothetical protein
VNACTVLVVDLVPARAGADIEVPTLGLRLDVHVSHHGADAVLGRVCAAWVPAGTPFPQVGVQVAPGTRSEVVKAEPYVLSPAVGIDVPAPGGVDAARLLLWLAGDSGTVLARTFVDAAPVEPYNRRGARTV